VGYLCAPVSGNAKVCRAGRLSVVASGPKALYDQAKPWLKALGRSTLWLGEGELARPWKIAHNTFLGVVIQSLCEITVMAEKAGIPRHVFLESINNSVLGSMFTKYKTPTLVNLTFDHVSFTPKLLLKDVDLGLAAAGVHGVPMPCAAAARASIAAMVGRGYDEVDFAVLLKELARSSGFEPQPENVGRGPGRPARCRRPRGRQPDHGDRSIRDARRSRCRGDRRAPTHRHPGARQRAHAYLADRASPVWPRHSRRRTSTSPRSSVP
jgi:hypothetical protein